MEDAQSKHPVCNDTYAKVFMKNEGHEIFERFKPFKDAKISNATRHRIIDDLIREELKRDPESLVIIIGAGFDTRAYRFNGGIWIELDDPGLIEYKNECLPVSECTNPLHRIPHDMTGDSLSERLSQFSTGKPPVIIIEGVFIYLTEEAMSKLIKVLRELFPEHLLFCDLQTLRCFRQFNLKFQEVLKGFGAALCITSDSPENVFLSHGYRMREKISILVKTTRYARLSARQLLIKLALNTFLRGVRDGYSIYCFEYGSFKGERKWKSG
jgi:methyltransferase (TIGR00027 family)